jgi:hypothetical protein
VLLPVAATLLLGLAAILIGTSPKVRHFFHAWRQRQRSGKGRW